jgi:hypothetical protein
MFNRMVWTAVFLMGLATIAAAQAPPSVPRHPYDITPEAGPWAICIRSFAENIDTPTNRDFTPEELAKFLADSQARHLAIQFVTELRMDPYKMPAYMFNRGDVERSKEEERMAEERRERMEFKLKNPDLAPYAPTKLHYKRLLHIQDQYLVLIGGYRDAEEARRSLDVVKRLKAPSKKFMDKLDAGFQDGSAGGGSGYMNPFIMAFVVPNPTNKEKLHPPPRDPNETIPMEELNAHNPFSPLGHAGKWTLLIKEYHIPNPVLGRNDHGQSVDFQKTGKMYELLGKQAESLATLLRNPRFGLEAYVIHSKFASFVTVGIFDSPQDPRLSSVQGALSTLTLKDVRGRMVEELMNPPIPIPIQPVKR